MNDTLEINSIPFYQWDLHSSSHVADTAFVGKSMIDSVFAHHAIAVPPQRPSLFQEHSLAVEHSGFLPLTHDAPPSWTFVILIVLTALLCIYYRQRKIRLGEMFSSIVDSRAMDRMLRNNNLTRTFQLIPMGLLMLATGTLVVHSLMFESFGRYLLLTLALAAAYLLRNGLIRLLGAIFDNSSAANLYITNNYLYHIVLATLLTPMLFLYFYLPDGSSTMLTLIGGVVVLEFVLRLFRGLKLFLTQSTGSHFYLFYYLCIVEIAPILILIKYL